MVLEGIANLTPTENKLRNFSRICKIVGDYKSVIEYKELVNKIFAEPSIRRGKGGKEKRYTKTIERHIKIMKDLEILTEYGGDISLASLGRAFYELIKDKSNVPEDLEPSGKAFYFITLFSEPVAIQLLLLLKSLGKNIESKNEKVRDYVESILLLPPDIRIFDRGFLRKCLWKYKNEGIFPRSIMNKFDCMVGWLNDLGLTKSLKLVPASDKILSEVKGEPHDVPVFYQRIQKKVVGLSIFLLNMKEEDVSNLDGTNPEHSSAFMNLFHDAYPKFYRPSIKMSDARAIGLYLAIRLLWAKNLVMERKDFEIFLKKQASEGVIRSLSKDDRGRLAYVEV